MLVDRWTDRPRPAPGHSSLLPRARRRPSERNLRIHDEVRVRRERQEDVAARHGLTQQRVSQICSQIEAWRMSQLASPDYEAIDANRRRQQLLECRAREETLLVLALRGAVAERRTLMSVKRVTTAEGVQETVTERGVPADPAWLKMARAASQSIARMNAELGLDVHTGELGEEIERLWGELLGREREEREKGREGEGESVRTPEEGAKSCTSCSDKPISGSEEFAAAAALMSASRGMAMSCERIGAGNGAAPKSKNFSGAKVLW